MNTDLIKKQKYEYMVCVHCLTYNHAKYLRKCLEGFVMQKTSFPYIVVIVDDASTDGSQSIILEYTERYPKLIQPVLLKENHYSLKKSIEPYYEPFVKKSKYVAFCEGDDFWIDPEKLQKQYDALEKHPDCKVCVHKVEKLFENGESQNKYLPSFSQRTGLIVSKKFIRMFCVDYPFQTSSYFVTGRDYYNYNKSDVHFGNMSKSADRSIIMYFGQLANAYYLDVIMSCYRVGSVGSHNERMINNPHFREETFSNIDGMTKAFDDYTKHKYHKECLLNLKRYRYNRVVIAHFAGEITTEQYEKEIVKKDYRLFFKMDNPLKVRLLIYLNVYFPYIGKFVKQHFVHSK